jgi:3',5'-cyclic-AMP phosphodiesterase
MRLAWATDLHLNFADGPARQQLIDSIRAQADVLVISGDIAESPSVARYLKEMESSLEKPIYFVLGNHDFYRSSIAATRRALAAAVGDSKHLVYLTQAGVVELTPATALVGHDGWADGRLGDFENSDVILNDFLLIRDLHYWHDPWTLDKPGLLGAVQHLAGEAARHVADALTQAAPHYARVIVVTHVPPFRETAWYQGRPSNDDFLPHFACQAMGDVLLDVARSYPACQLLVLCGHTHGGGEVQVLENLRVWTGAAEYGKPQLAKVFPVE